MLKFAFNNVNCYVQHDDTPEDREMVANLSHCLSYTPKGSQFLPGKAKYKTFSMLYEAEKYIMFPTGLISFVLNNKHKRKIKLPDGTLGDKFENYEIKAEVIDNRNPPFGKEMEVLNLWDEKADAPLKLHDYQEEAVKTFLAKERGIIRVSTRGGKTIIGIALTQIISRKTLFIVHTKDLVGQTVTQYKNKMKLDVGVIGDGEWRPMNITVSTIQTLSRRAKEQATKDFLGRVEFVIWDETHHNSKTYQQVSRMLKNAYYRLGLSATVGMGNKEEKLKAMALSGPMIFDIKMEKLVEHKQLAKPTCIFIRIPRMDDDPRWELMDYSEQYEQGIIHNKFRNMVLAHAVMEMREQGNSSLVLVEKLFQGENIASLLDGHDWKVVYISGKDKVKTRENAASNLLSGDIDVLITSRIFNEGRDLPALESVVVASGYKSPGLTLQRYGRGVTKTALKETTTIFDCYDEFAPKLKDHSEARMAVVKKNKAFDVMLIEWQDIEKTIAELMEKRRKTGD